MTQPPALLLVAHGSRDPRHAATMAEIARAVRAARPGCPVEVGFLDHHGPDLSAATRRLPRGAQVHAVPLLLSRAFHRKVDVPAAVEAVRTSTARGVEVAAELGPDPALLGAARRRLHAAGGAPAPGSGVVLAYAGTSDAVAAAAVTRLARLWSATDGADVRVAHAAATGPAVAETVAALRCAGADRVDVATWFLAPGRLLDRVDAESRAAGADAVAAPLGAAAAVVAAVLARLDASARRARVA